MLPLLMVLYRMRCDLDVLALKLIFCIKKKIQFDFFNEEIAVLTFF